MNLKKIKDSKISVSELRKRGFSHSGVDYLSGLNWFTVYGPKEDVQKAVKDLKDKYKGKVSVKSGHLKKLNGQFEQEVRIKTSKIQDRMNLKNYKKIKDAAKPAWVREFEKMSKGMPYNSEYDQEYDQITVKVSGCVDDIEPTANEWMKKAYEADSKEEVLNYERWNPSWDVAEEALEYVCKKLGLEGYNEEVGASPEMDMFWISNPKEIKDARKVPADLVKALRNLPVTVKFDQETFDEEDDYQWIVKFDYLDTDEEFSAVNSAIESAIEKSGKYEVVDTDEGDSCMYYFVMKKGT